MESSQEKDTTSLKIASIVDNGCKVKGMDMVMKPENQARNTLAIERTTKERGMVSIKMRKVMNMMAYGKTMSSGGREHTHGKMVIIVREIGRRINFMGKRLAISNPMAKFTGEILNMG